MYWLSSRNLKWIAYRVQLSKALIGALHRLWRFWRKDVACRLV